MHRLRANVLNWEAGVYVARCCSLNGRPDNVASRTRQRKSGDNALFEVSTNRQRRAIHSVQDQREGSKPTHVTFAL